MKILIPTRVLTLTMVLATVVSPCLGNPRIVNSCGQQIGSIFAGVTSRQAPMGVSSAKHRGKDVERPFVPADIPSLVSRQAGLKLVTCDLGECCVGHFIYVYPVSGRCYMNACHVNNTYESTILAEYLNGAFPWQCSQYCCDTAFSCTNDGVECL